MINICILNLISSIFIVAIVKDIQWTPSNCKYFYKKILKFKGIEHFSQNQLGADVGFSKYASSYFRKYTINCRHDFDK